MEQVERDGAVPDVEIHLVHRHVFLQRAAGAVHDHVEPAEPRHRRFDRAAHLIVFRDVGLDEERVAAGFADLALRALARFAAELDDRDFRAFSHVGLGGRFRDACSAARQKCHFAFESSQFVLLV